MHIKRLLLLGLSIVGLCLVTHSVLVSANPGATNERCGLGAPPGTPGFAEEQARDAEEVRRYGFLRVCEANLKRYDMSFSPIAAAAQDLAFHPVDLSKTPFAKLKSLGSTAEAVNRTKSRLYRGFRMPDGHKLTLFEHDMSADGVRMWRDPKDETEKVGNLPAHLSVFQAGSGNAVSVLSWMQGRRYYELWLDANVALTSRRQQLFALAASLPTSVPACPNEPAPEPFHIGADGMPVFAPAPDFLTDEQVKESLEKETRRCR